MWNRFQYENTFFILLFLFFLSFVLNAGRVSAVMYSSDILILYENGVPIQDNSILLIIGSMEKLNVAKVKVCKKGTCDVSQAYAGEAFTFFKTSERVFSYGRWLREYPNEKTFIKGYEQYLRERMGKAVYSVVISLPSPVDQTISGSRPPFSSGKPRLGGIIGHYRKFNIDLKIETISRIEKGEKEEKSRGLEFRAWIKEMKTRRETKLPCPDYIKNFVYSEDYFREIGGTKSRAAEKAARERVGAKEACYLLKEELLDINTNEDYPGSVLLWDLYEAYRSSLQK